MDNLPAMDNAENTELLEKCEKCLIFLEENGGDRHNRERKLCKICKKKSKSRDGKFYIMKYYILETNNLLLILTFEVILYIKFFFYYLIYYSTQNFCYRVLLGLGAKIFCDVIYLCLCGLSSACFLRIIVRL